MSFSLVAMTNLETGRPICLANQPANTSPKFPVLEFSTGVHLDTGRAHPLAQHSELPRQLCGFESLRGRDKSESNTLSGQEFGPS